MGKTNLDAADQPIFAAADAVGPGAIPGGVSVLAAERVTLHAITLPVRTARQKAAALPFALEDRLGKGLEGTHVAYCGEAGTSGHTLAAVTSAGVMAQAVAERPGHPVIAEQFLLAAPEVDEEGQNRWRCLCQGSRVLVRCSDGTGFAAHADALAALWHLAGQPDTESFGTPLPEGIAARHRGDDVPPLADIAGLADLRQGDFRPNRGLGKPLKWLAAACVLAAVGHLGIAAADARAQRSLADDLQQTAQAALVSRLPDASVEAPPALLQRQLAVQSRPQPGSAFLPLMNRVSTALSILPDTVQFRELGWAENTPAPDTGGIGP